MHMYLVISVAAMQFHWTTGRTQPRILRCSTFSCINEKEMEIDDTDVNALFMQRKFKVHMSIKIKYSHL